MHKLVYIASAICLSIAIDTPAYAAKTQCHPAPSCADLGYTVTGCPNGVTGVKCPFDNTKLFCPIDCSGYPSAAEDCQNRQKVNGVWTTVTVAECDVCHGLDGDHYRIKKCLIEGEDYNLETHACFEEANSANDLNCLGIQVNEGNGCVDPSYNVGDFVYYNGKRIALVVEVDGNNVVAMALENADNNIEVFWSTASASVVNIDGPFTQTIEQKLCAYYNYRPETTLAELEQPTGNAVGDDAAYIQQTKCGSNLFESFPAIRIANSYRPCDGTHVLCSEWTLPSAYYLYKGLSQAVRSGISLPNGIYWSTSDYKKEYKVTSSYQQNQPFIDDDILTSTPATDSIYYRAYVLAIQVINNGLSLYYPAYRTYIPNASYTQAMVRPFISFTVKR